MLKKHLDWWLEQMAWISVDQKLIGGKLRKLYKAIGCSQNEAVGILIGLWLWGIDNAGKDGLIVSADREDIEEFIQSGLSANLDPRDVVRSLIETGWIDYEDGHYYIHDWQDWNRYYTKYVEEKEKHAERMRRYREKQYSQAPLETAPSVQEGKTEKKGAKRHNYGTEFEEFWSIYPRKDDKGEAFAKYSARRKDGFSAEELKAAAESYKKQCEQRHTEKQYIKQAKTFLGVSLPFTQFIPKEPEPEQQESGNPFRRNGG